MKIKLLIIAFVWFLISAFLFNLPGDKQNNNQNQNPNTNPAPKPFIIGSMGNGWYDDYPSFAAANFNLWHIYSSYEDIGHYRYPTGWTVNDKVFAPIDNYMGDIIGIMRRNAGIGMSSYLMRPKIEYLCYGQHSVYQCEPLPVDSVDNSTDWFYSYYTHQTGEPIPGGTGNVMFCSYNDTKSSPGYVAMNLKSNRELCNRVPNNLPCDIVYDWYFLPSIKVPQNIGDETRVCKIEIVNWEGNVVNTLNLKGKNFKVQNYYSGLFMEEFNWNNNNQYEPYIISAAEAENFNPNARNWWETNGAETDSQFDIRVYWYKETDMWIDYVKVENTMAYELLRGDRDDWIQQEASAFSQDPALKPYKFYVEEVEYNTLPCIKYVNEKLSAYGQSVVCVPYMMVPPRNRVWTDFNTTKIASVYAENGITEILNSYYPFHGHKFSIYGYGKPSYIPNTFAGYQYDLTQGRLGYPAPPSDYDNNVQELIDDPRLFNLKASQIVSKLTNKPFIFMVQAHCFTNDAKPGFEDNVYSQREPTNEELEMMACLGLTYGAKGIMWFSYNSDRDYNPNPEGYYNYAKGLLENPRPDITKRTVNSYGQNKWGKVVSMNQKLRVWEPYLVSFDDNYTESYKFHIQAERNALIANTFIEDIKTYPTGNPASCPETNPDYNIPDPVNQSYVQVGVFKDQADVHSHYLMLVNRRCSPGSDACSGKRKIITTFVSDNNLAGFNNWKIINTYDNSVIATFDKRQPSSIDFGYFEPGEGKLYKIAPVMQEGGTFVCDEQVINTSFVCKGPVHTGGNNLSLLAQNSGQMEISFKQGAQIIGESGSNILIWGSNNHVILKGALGNKWNGIVANDVSDFNMERVDISDISSGWSISVYNCPITKINDCYLNLDENVKAINVNSTSISNSILILYNNLINVKNNSYTMFLGSAAGTSSDLFFFNNTITSIPSSQLGVLLSNINSIDISYNRIIGFKTGLKLMGSTLDLASNTITNTGDGTVGIQGVSLSTINMGLIGTSYMGHDNSIYSNGNNCKNISLDNSVFQMDYGNNDLKVDIGTGSYNLFGNGNFVVNDDGPQKYIEIKGNCFNGEGNNVIQYLTDPYGYLFNVHEFPHNCSQQQDMIADFVVPLTANRVDTVYKTTNAALQNSSASKTLYRNLYLNFIKKNYDSTVVIGTNLLTNYPDSISTNDVISKLYFSTIKIDTIGPKIASLKTFYEQLILNNSQNVMLVKSANYYIQKCKVHLEQYTSALDGFQDIMVQNPFSYEGVLASWDYAATLLLANSSGGFSNSEITDANVENEYLTDTLRINKLLRNDIYDKKVFTTDDRKQLIQSIGNVLKDDRKKQLEKVKILEDKFGKSDEKSKDKIKQDLFEAKIINSVVKVKRPKDGNDYLVIVNNDIEKLHPKSESSNNGINNILPTTYALYQNYPNPFNPTTKIAYDIPLDAKVKLVIYDILGREMKTLVNNEFRSAGKYITEFNGSNLASGVYFARILVNEGKDFMAVKKMVLIK